MKTSYFAIGFFILLFAGLCVWSFIKARKKEQYKPPNLYAEKLDAKEEMVQLVDKKQWATKPDPLQEVRLSQTKIIRKFYDKANDWHDECIAGSRSLNAFTKGLLEIVEAEIRAYQFYAKKKSFAYANFPMYYQLLLSKFAYEVQNYSDQKNYQDITKELVEFTDKYFNVRNLWTILNRYRATIQYSARCDAMSKAILAFYGREVPKHDVDNVSVPFDYLDDKYMMTWGLFHKKFYQHAIDENFTLAMKKLDRNRYEAEARNENQEFRRKRRQRNRREFNAKRKASRSKR